MIIQLRLNNKQVSEMSEKTGVYDVHGNELNSDQLQSLSEFSDGLQLSPFLKTNFKTAESRDKWNDILSTVHELSSEMEYWSLLSDATDRKIKIIHYSHDNREQWLNRVSEDGLHFKHIHSVERYEGYNNTHVHTTKHDPNRMSYSAIGTSQDVVEKAHEAETELTGEERHRTMGKLLGFPDCCVEYFIDSWVNFDGPHDKVDNIFSIAQNTDNSTVLDDKGNTIRIDDPEPYTNILWKPFGWKFITHTPCSYDCQHTVDVAKKRGRIAAEHGYRDEINALYNWLDKPMEWSGFKALTRLANADMLGSYQCTPYWDKKTVIWKGEHPSESVRGDAPAGNV